MTRVVVKPAVVPSGKKPATKPLQVFGGLPPIAGPVINDIYAIRLGQARGNAINVASTPNGPAQLTVAGDGTVVPMVFGQRRVGGKIFAIGFIGADLVVGFSWCLGPCQAIVKVQLNDADAPASGVTITNYLGAAGQGVDPTLALALGVGYTDTLPGICYSVVRVSPGVTSGFPRAAAIVQGLKVRQVENAFITLNGTTQAATTPAGTQNAINEDFELTLGAKAADWTPTADQVLMSKWNVTGNQRCFRLLLKTTGALSLEVSTDGTAVTTYTSSANLAALANGALKWVRVRFFKSTGGVSKAQFATSDDGQAWTALGADQTTTTIAALFASSANLIVGADTAGAWFAGSLYAWRMSTAAKLVCEVVVLELTPSATSFTDAAAAVWTLGGAAAVNAFVAYSRIPVNALIHLIVDKAQGLGRRVDVGTALLTYALNTMQVGTSPLENYNELDISLDTMLEGRVQVNAMRDYAHCYAIEEGDKFYLIRDWSDAATWSFDASNIVQDSLTLQRRGAREATTVVEITYTDTSKTPWADERIYQYLPGVQAGTRKRVMSRIQKQGITRGSEANRYAIERLNDAAYNDMATQFQAIDDAANIRPGSLILVSYPYAAGNAANTINNKKFRVLSAEPIGPGRYQVSAQEQDDNRYSVTVAPGTSSSETPLPRPDLPPAVTVNAPTEYLFQTFDGLYSSAIKVTWTHATFPFVQFYAVEVYEGSVAPANIRHRAQCFAAEYVTPPLKEKVLYVVKVWIRSTVNVDGTAGTNTVTPLGKFLPPSDVPSVTGFEAGGRVFLTWGVAIDLSLDTIRYEVRYGAVGTAWAAAVRLDRVSALTWASPGFPTGTYRFLVKAIDSVGNYSANAAFVDVTVSVDNAAFSAFSYSNLAVVHQASTEWQLRDGTRYAATDWGDGVEYGHATQLNTTGTFNDGVMAATVFTQPHRQSLRFTSAYVSIPNAAAYAVSSLFTVEAWVFPLDVSTGRFAIFSTRSNAAAGGWQLEVGVGSGGTGRLAVVGGTATYFAESIDGAVPLGKWSHVRAIVNGTTNTACTLWVNDVEVTYNQRNAFAALANNTDAKWLGAGTGPSVSQRFNGFILRTKLWNKALTAAQATTSMQYHNDPTTIGGMVGAWQGNDAGQGASSTVYADSSATANNGAVVGTPDWRSWHAVLTAPVDLGQVVNGTFTVSGGDATALSGVVAPQIQVSVDGVTYTTYSQPAVVASGRFFRFGYEAQGGSMLLNLSNLRGDVLVTPRAEIGTLSLASTAVPTADLVVLAGLYGRVIDLQLTPAQTTNAWFATPDAIEVGSAGISGAVCVRWMDAANSYATRASFALGASVTFEAWVYLDAHDATNGEAVFNIAPDAAAAANLYVAPDGSLSWNGAFGTQYFLNAGARVAMSLQRWVHVAVVLDAVAVNTYLYINDTLAGATGAFQDPTTTSTARTFALNYNGSSVFIMPGRMYDFRVWNEARTAAQIAANYRSRVASGGNLIAYWKMDEKTGTALADSSGNGRTMTLQGAAWNASTGNYWWRPINGFDVYLFNNSAARQSGAGADVRYRWTGA
jgi:hypothetical protein